MNNVHQKYSQGGDFVISPISELDIFTREDFSEEHKEIYNMVMDFDKDKVLTQKKEIESYNPKLSKKLLDEMAELGLLGIDIPEELLANNSCFSSSSNLSEFLPIKGRKYENVRSVCILGTFEISTFSINPSITLKKTVAAPGSNSWVGRITLTKGKPLLENSCSI